MDAYNAGRDYGNQVRPFGFMVRFTAKPATDLAMTEDLDADPHKRGRPKKQVTPKPIAPFEQDPAMAAAAAFDRETGKAVPMDRLKTYADLLRSYHLSPEAKFENGDFWDSGETRRRHVVATSVELVGKEANGVGEFGEQVDPTGCDTLASVPAGVMQHVE